MRRLEGFYLQVSLADFARGALSPIVPPLPSTRPAAAVAIRPAPTASRAVTDEMPGFGQRQVADEEVVDLLAEAAAALDGPQPGTA